jgi:carbonic anhydrase
MSIIDKTVEANRRFAKGYDRSLGARPAPRIAVVTCMDPRLSDLSGILGLPQADIDVIRTGGPAVTEDVLGELVVSTHVLGSREILLLNHTGCGFATFTDGELNAKLSASTGGCLACTDVDCCKCPGAGLHLRRGRWAYERGAALRGRMLAVIAP